MHLSGSPRADFWSLLGRATYNSPKLKVNLSPVIVKSKDYILFATSFGNANHFLGSVGQKYLLDSVASYKDLSDCEIKSMQNNFFMRRELATTLLPIYEEILIQTAKTNPDTLIVVRPHPSEGEDFWRDCTKDCTNVLVTSEGSVTDWILGSKCLVQYGSSTAIEAHLLSIPVVTCIPDDLPTALKQLNIGHTEAVSKVVQNASQAVNEISKIIRQGSKTYSQKRGVLSDILHEYESAGNASKIL